MNSHYHLYLERRDPALNMQRFYVLSVDRSLFGELLLTRRWGRIGTFGQEKIESFEREQDAVLRLLALARRKRARHYRPARPQDAADLVHWQEMLE